MKISSKLKKIISFMLVTVLTVSAVVLPLSAEELTTEETEHKTRFNMEAFPTYTKADLEYTGEVSTDLKEKFNIAQEYDMSFTKQDYYISRPFTFGNWLTMPDSMSQSFSQAWLWNQFEIGQSDAAYPTSANFEDYDVYYVLYTGRHYIYDYNIAGMIYYLVPHGAYIALCNDDDNDTYPGVYVKESSLWKNNGNDIAHSVITIERRLDDEERIIRCVLDASVDSRIVQWGNQQLIASNIPVFDYRTDVLSYLDSQPTLHDPHGNVPEPEEKVGADAFYWDSLKCKLVRDGDNYKVVFDYRYSVPDMVANPSDYAMYVDVTQDYKYKAKNNSSILNGQSKVTSTSCDIGASPGRVSCDSALFCAEAYGNSLGSFCVFGATAVSDLLGHGYDWADITFYNSYISVYVELVHNYPADSSSLRVKDKVSSDIRSFTFDALTLKSIDDISDIDSTENEVNVKTKDTVDDTGKVTDRRVESVVVNDTTTNQTINNYYYDGNGNKSDNSSGNGSALNDILSGLISFIKTLVTEGLPAAIEILKTVIKSISDLVSSALDGLNVGEGSSNGIIAVLKCIPASCWSLVVIAVIILVVVGVLKHIF